MPSANKPKYNFSYTERLHRQKDFKNVLNLGRRVCDPAIFVYTYIRDDSKPITRMGLVTSGKVAIAAKRNLVKRRLREIFRLNKHRIIRGVDIVFIPKAPAVGLKYSELEEKVLKSLKTMGAI